MPLAASRNAPVQTDVMRRVCLAFSRTQSTRAGSSAAPYTPQPPAITNVSHGASAAGNGSATRARPAEVITGSAWAAITDTA